MSCSCLPNSSYLQGLYKMKTTSAAIGSVVIATSLNDNQTILFVALQCHSSFLRPLPRLSTLDSFLQDLGPQEFIWGSTKRLSEMLLSKHLPNMVQSWHVIQIACKTCLQNGTLIQRSKIAPVFEKSFICWCLRHGCSHWHDRPRSFWTIWWLPVAFHGLDA